MYKYKVNIESAVVSVEIYKEVKDEDYVFETVKCSKDFGSHFAFRTYPKDEDVIAAKQWGEEKVEFYNNTLKE